LENYDIVPEEEGSLHKQKTSMITDPAKRREVKIKQYQKEKDLRARIEVHIIVNIICDSTHIQSQAVRKRRGQLPLHSDNVPSDFHLISSLLPSPPEPKSSATPDDDDEPDSEMDDILREATILLLRLCYAQAHSHLESMELELELLRTAPPSPPRHSQPPTDDRRGKVRESESDMWKLDAPSNLGADGKGPLLDSSGKVITVILLH
jgi:immunoglobulin-binding protein 1